MDGPCMNLGATVTSVMFTLDYLLETVTISVCFFAYCIVTFTIFRVWNGAVTKPTRTNGAKRSGAPLGRQICSFVSLCLPCVHYLCRDKDTSLAQDTPLWPADPRNAAGNGLTPLSFLVIGVIF